jgi:LysM repeat protein
VLKTGAGSDDQAPTPKPKKTPKPTKKPTKTPKPTPKPTKKPKSSNKSTYTVQRGDHLMKIARKLQLNWRAIAELNNLTSPYTLYPGQKLKLPGTDAGPPPAPLPEESSSKPKKKKENTPKPSGKTYTVKKGDWLYALAREWGINWKTLASLNGITYPYIIHPGQVLKLP